MPVSGQASARVSRAALFAALGDDTRLGLITRLCGQGPTSISRLSAGSGVSRQAITKHLRVMEGAGLARGVRLGRESVWELDVGRLEEARAHLAEISAQWDAALERFRRFVES